MSREKATREKVTNPPGFLATYDLKERGWTPALIARFLGEHDDIRPNGMKMGRRRLPPVKLYREDRVNALENDDTFLAAQAKASDARERNAQAKAQRQHKRQQQLEQLAARYVPTIHPEPLRKGATHKAREPYLRALKQEQKRLERDLLKVTEAESIRLRMLLLERLDTALAQVYDWFPAPGEAKVSGRAGQAKGESVTAAKASDWREWDWD